MKTPYRFSMGPWPCVAISPTVIFGAYHVTKDHTTARVVDAEGAPYYGSNPQWVRTELASGGHVEEAGCDYNFKERMWIGHDSEFCTTYRAVPEECVTRHFFTPEVGKTIVVEGRVSGVKKAKIIAVGTLYLQTDFVPQYGDSDSLVYGEDDSFAGAVSSGVRGDNGEFVGSIIACPPQVADPILAGTTPWGPNDGTPTPAPIADQPAPIIIPAPAEPPSSEPIEKPAIFATASNIFAAKSDGTIYKLSGNAWEKLPALPSK